MSGVSKKVRTYIEKAVRQKIAETCPGYGQNTVERIVRASMDGLHVTKDVLYRAIALAGNEASTQPVENIDKPTCEWTFDSESEEWETDCGNHFYFSDDTSPETFYFKYCPYCGKRIEIVEVRDE